MRASRMLALAVGLGLAAPVGLSATHVARAQDLGTSAGSVRLNAIIQDLKPVPRARRGGTYAKKVRRVLVPVRPKASTGYSDGTVVVDRPFVLNYNHTVDLEIFFPFDSAEITPRARLTLDVLGEALSSPDLRDAIYLIAGHTDSRGKADYNQWLSERRAAAAKDYLVRNFPIEPLSLVAVGFGERELFDPDAPAAAVNRRVEVTLIEAAESDAPVVGRLEEEPVALPTPSVDAARAATGNVICDTALVRRSDARPARNGLDDFGGVRTPAECEEAEGASADAEGPLDTNDLIRN